MKRPYHVSSNVQHFADKRLIFTDERYKNGRWKIIKSESRKHESLNRLSSCLPRRIGQCLLRLSTDAREDWSKSRSFEIVSNPVIPE